MVETQSATFNPFEVLSQVPPEADLQKLNPDQLNLDKKDDSQVRVDNLSNDAMKKADNKGEFKDWFDKTQKPILDDRLERRVENVRRLEALIEDKPGEIEKETPTSAHWVQVPFGKEDNLLSKLENEDVREEIERITNSEDLSSDNVNLKSEESQGDKTLLQKTAEFIQDIPAKIGLTTENKEGDEQKEKPLLQKTAEFIQDIPKKLHLVPSENKDSSDQQKDLKEEDSDKDQQADKPKTGIFGKISNLVQNIKENVNEAVETVKEAVLHPFDTNEGAEKSDQQS